MSNPFRLSSCRQRQNRVHTTTPWEPCGKGASTTSSLTGCWSPHFLSSSIKTAIPQGHPSRHLLLPCPETPRRSQLLLLVPTTSRCPNTWHRKSCAARSRTALARRGSGSEVLTSPKSRKHSLASLKYTHVIQFSGLWFFIILVSRTLKQLSSFLP